MNVSISRTEAEAWIRFENGRGNILDATTCRALRGAVEEVGADVGLKALVFEGVGDDFCYGASVEEHRREQVAEMFGTFHGLFRAIEATHVPTAAVVRGRCLGGGLELAAFCGRVFANPTATFALPEIKLGVFPPMGTLVLDWRCAGPVVTRMVATGAMLHSGEAVAAGVIDEVSADPVLAAQRWAESMASLSASSLRIAWKAARLSLTDRIDRDLPRLEALYLEELMATRDANEGIAAFLGRRPPSWVNA